MTTVSSANSKTNKIKVSNSLAEYYSDLSKSYAEQAAESAANAEISAEAVAQMQSIAETVTELIEENKTSLDTVNENIEAVQNASENAQTAITKAAEASTSANNAQIWAEGDDEEVEELGGTHSSLVSASLSYAYANADEDTEVEDFLLNNQVVIKGEKGNEAYTQGTGIDITDGVITNSMPGQWGKITGTVSEQTDLQNALNKKANAADVPTKTSELINDSNYITSTDYADINSSGVVRVAGKYGTHMSDEYLCISRAAKSDIDAKTHQYRPITPYTLDYAVKTSLSTNTEILTDDEKSAIREWLGINEDWVKNIVSEVINGSDEDTSGTDNEYSDEEAPSL